MSFVPGFRMKMWKKITMFQAFCYLLVFFPIFDSGAPIFVFLLSFHRRSLLDSVSPFGWRFDGFCTRLWRDNGHSGLIALLGHVGTSLGCFNALQKK